MYPAARRLELHRVNSILERVVRKHRVFDER